MRFQVMFFRLVILAVVSAAALASPLLAQPGNKKDDGKKGKAAPVAPAAPAPAAKGSDAKAPEAKASDAKATTEEAKKFEAMLSEWKQVLKELRALKVKYQTAPAAEFDAIQSEWNQLMAKGDKMVPELRELGQAAFLAAPNEDRQLLRFLLKLIEDDIVRDDYEHASELAGVLIANDCDQAEVYALAGVAAFVLSDFDKAAEYLKKAQDAGAISDVIKSLPKELQGIATLPKAAFDEGKKQWAKEMEFRTAEAEKDDLPRVRLKTTKGDIVLELFENEAPETVGNFVSLVSSPEKPFYDGLTFHRVLPAFMAQGGCPKGDGKGGPGYQIYDECKKENARIHFRGSLSMAHSGADTGGSQFFLTFVPTPQLNHKHTVFGRVIEGFDVLAKIQRRNPEEKVKPEPDKIISAEVIRKRDHVYAPNKVQ